jgi:hypothetical protein
VTLTFLRWYTREFVATLVDTMQNAGSYMMNFDVTHWTNGIYIMRLVINDSTSERRIVLMNPDITALLAATPLAVTDAKGRVLFADEQFGFGVPFQVTSSDGTGSDTLFISPAIQILLHKEGYQTTLQPLFVDVWKDQQARIVLKK